MKKHTLFLTLSLALHFLTFGQSVETRIQHVIDSLFDAHPAAVGIMVHVEAPDRALSWSGASGFGEKGDSKSLEADRPALIASNIKTYVSATILRLVEEGKLTIDQPIRDLLTKKTRKLFEGGGYNLEAIHVKHLLSHTSGIQNYANDDYIEAINKDKEHRWTRDEQLELTISAGPPLGGPGFTFNYTDANYLLLTEIIEGRTGEPFYTAMRDLLGYEQLGLVNTWMPTLEEKPAGTKPLVHQYWTEMGWDSYDIDVSVDLYGGGGIACPPRDLTLFAWDLLNGRVVQDPAVLNLIYTEVLTNDPEPSNYYLGLAPEEYRGLTGYGHSGFWGTSVLWFPDLNASVAVYILDRDLGKLKPLIMQRIVEILVDSD